MQNTDPSSIVGVFRDHAMADHAIEELKQAGFREDQILSTVYTLQTAQEAQTPENTRIIITVQADGRDQQAFGILFNNGANNTDLPPGMTLSDSTVISAQPETVDLISEQAVQAAPSEPGFFVEEKAPGRVDGIDIMDNPNFPHG
jgi:hypothetical protein